MKRFFLSLCAFVVGSVSWVFVIIAAVLFAMGIVVALFIELVHDFGMEVIRAAREELEKDDERLPDVQGERPADPNSPPRLKVVGEHRGERDEDG